MQMHLIGPSSTTYTHQGMYESQLAFDSGLNLFTWAVQELQGQKWKDSYAKRYTQQRLDGQE